MLFVKKLVIYFNKMKTNNKKSLVLSKIYNIFFITSFIISLIFFLIFIIITVNIKFLIYPQLIPNILSLFSSIDYLYEYFFCNPSNRFYFVSLIAIINDLYFVLSIFISTMLIYYLNKKYNKFILYKILNSVVFLILFLFKVLIISSIMSKSLSSGVLPEVTIATLLAPFFMLS